MKRDPLCTLLRVRRATLDEAQMAVAEAYRIEQEASNRAETAAASLDRETRAAMNLEGDDAAVETFARWLPIGRRALQQAHNAQRDATAALDRARAMLALARSGVRTVETLMEKRQIEQYLEATRREQRVLDETGSRNANR